MKAFQEGFDALRREAAATQAAKQAKADSTPDKAACKTAVQKGARPAKGQ
ncbi:MAG: hypothetical protein KGL10_07590 [Alphaproteobacteria bacterium]|nr:hypothetical protein [Alphaproteobacteria bacterium]MDE2337158.1 hypothetical protein [Alphaproteobacteria bacterium]